MFTVLVLLDWQGSSRIFLKSSLSKQLNLIHLNILNKVLLKHVVPGIVGKLMFKPLNEHL